MKLSRINSEKLRQKHRINRRRNDMKHRINRCRNYNIITTEINFNIQMEKS